MGESLDGPSVSLEVSNRPKWPVRVNCASQSELASVSLWYLQVLANRVTRILGQKLYFGSPKGHYPKTN